MSNRQSNSSSGIGFLGILTIVFIVLKLTNNITWSWFWVLSPYLIPFMIFLLFLILTLILKSL